MNKIDKARKVLKMSTEAKKLMKDERTAFVLDLFLKEYRSTEIEKAYVDKFNETARNARNYIKKVKDTLKKEGEVDKAGKIAKAIKQYEMIFKELIEAKKFPEAGLILEKKNKLEGLEAAKQIVTTNFTFNANPSEDQFKHLSLEQKLNIAKMLKAPDNESGTGAEVIE